MLKLIVTEHEKGLLSFLLEDGRTMRLSLSKAEGEASFGDIFRARVQTVNKGLHCAFLEIGGGQTAYLNTGAQSVKPGQELTVQITQESYGTKLPTISSEISLPGELVVLTDEPGSLAFSRRAEFDGYQRELLHEQLLPLMENNGFILRTAAEKAEPEAIEREAAQLAARFAALRQKAEHSPAPALIEAGQPIWLEWLQGLNKADLEEVITDVPAVHEQLSDYFVRCGLPSEKLRLYQDPMLGLKQLYSAEKRIAEATGRKVWLDSGAYLILDRTEAMTVIDVNSGKDDKAARSAQAAEDINREAAREIARQLQLRNISGMIAVDFINMTRAGAQAELMAYMRSLTGSDPVYVKVLDITALGLMELTRRRIRRPLGF
ncbi:MAG: ribonuclease E/G [Lachnospiraceae bacterium]|nr:ribonuclease E/G [Lachnospiraceae bacterium]